MATQSERLTKVRSILANSSTEECGLEIPALLPAYIGVEESSDGCVLWAHFGSLSQIAEALEASESEGVVRRRAYCLDNDEEFAPISKIIRWAKV